ncbi:MYB FAMILY TRANSCRIPTION FACTOR PHL11 [Salix viminalis]|uniref:MYB FAMILY TRANSCRIPTION FACTOR PHL11 n=1 Tax=Salix viminalis TaxID=40686 RepID=A0A9Q0U8B1_SALVM|nr:MYB FAMILY TRANSCRIPTION FACTOR PHL11 [Salix viminalis]
MPSALMQTHDREPPCFQRESGHLLITTDPKPRLRWTLELHEQFVDAVTLLGGPDKATPKAIMRIMGVKGLTLYHLKSHLQKFRLGKQPQNYLNEQAIRDATDHLKNLQDAATARIFSDGLDKNMHQNEVLRTQIQAQGTLDEQLKVKHHLQKRIDAQRKYIQTILENAYRTVSAENRLFDDQRVVSEMGSMKEIFSASNFPPIYDLQTYEDHSHDGFLPTDDSMSSCTIPMISYDDMQLQQIGTLAPCLASEEELHQMITIDGCTLKASWD